MDRKTGRIAYRIMSKAPWPMMTFCVRSMTPGRTVTAEGREVSSLSTKTDTLVHSLHSISGALMARLTSSRSK